MQRTYAKNIIENNIPAMDLAITSILYRKLSYKSTAYRGT